jgi:two-component system sensor kinase FixL
MSPDITRAEAPVGAVLDTAVDAIISIDPDCRVRLFNRAAERIFGYTADEVLGRNVNFLMPEPYAAEHDGYVANYLATGRKKIIGIGREVVARRKDGSTFPADLAVGEDPGNPVHRFVGFIRDISDRKRSEVRIREQASLIDLVPDAILVRDLDDRIRFWNKAAERL